MGWNGMEGDADWDREMLWRIVALLFSLAGLADLAAGLPVRRRRAVLGILVRGEAAAWAFALRMATGAPSLGEELEACALAPAQSIDATRIAAGFRALALVLCLLVARLPRPGNGARPRIAPRTPAGQAGVPCRTAPVDTS